MTLAERLAIIRPGQAWRVVFNNDGTETLEWNDPAPRPTSAELLEAARIAQSFRITAARNAALKTLTASWGGDTWDADEDTSSRIANALFMVKEAAAIGIPAPTSIPWRTADNKDRTLTITELTQMGAAVFLAQQAVWAKQAQLKNAIAAAPSEAAAKGVVW